MAARMFSFYGDHWQNEIIECPNCHWKGTIMEAGPRYFKEVMDCECPNCDNSGLLAIVNYSLGDGEDQRPRIFKILSNRTEKNTAIEENGLNGRTTTAAFRDSITGEWTPARVALHGSIVDDLLAGKQPKDKPKICIVGGGLGVGKSTFIKSTVIAKFPGAVVIDADQFWLKIPEYEALAREDWRTVGDLTYQELRYIRDLTLAVAVSRRLYIVLETVGDPTLKELVQLLKQAGYQIALEWLDRPIEAARRAVQKRANQNPTPEDNLWCSPPNRDFPDKFQYQNVDVKTFAFEYKKRLREGTHI